MAFCKKCGSEEPTLSERLCASCERVFGTAAERHFKAKRLQFDLAYGGYSLFGLLFLLASAWMAGFVPYPTGFALLIYLEFPFLIFVLPLVVVALALSLKHWRHWPLPLLGALTVLLTILQLGTEFPSPVAVRVDAVYGLVVLMFSGLWFGANRWRQFPAAADSTTHGC